MNFKNLIFRIKDLLPPLRRNNKVFWIRPVDENEIPKITRTHIWTGAMGTIAFGLFIPTGLYFTYFALAHEFSKAQLGILSAVVAASVVFQILSSYFERKFETRKYPWYIFSTLSWIVYFPLLFLNASILTPWVIVFICFTAVVLRNLGMPLWFSWVYDMIPGPRLGTFWAARARGISFFSLIVMLGFGIGMDQVPEEYKLMFVKGILALGIALGMMDIVWHVRIPEPPISKKEKKTNFLEEFLLPLKNHRFRHWIAALSVWTFSIAISGPFCVAYMLEDLHLDKFLINTLLIMVIPAISSILFLPLWGKIVDRKGPRPVLLICRSLWATIPLYYYLASPENAAVIMIIPWFLAGLSCSGTLTAEVKVTAALSEKFRKTTCVAILMIAVTLGASLGALVGSLVVKYYGIENCFPVSLVCRTLSVIPFALIFLPKNNKARQ